MNLSKYKISSQLAWADNLGRWTVQYKSEVYPIQTMFLIPDDYITTSWNEPDKPTLLDKTTDVLDLNFWFVCFQYEQNLKNTEVHNSEGPTDNA